jgi:predicted enzyme related to lactoylglutathione lyase
MAVEQKLPGMTAAAVDRDSMLVGAAVFSNDPARLSAFYSKVLQLAFEHRVHDDGREHHIAEVGGGVRFEIKALTTAAGERTSDAGSAEATGAQSRSEISFRVNDVAKASASALVSGARILQKAEVHAWGTFAVIVDPDGNRLGLWSPPQSTDNSNSDLEGQA